MYIVIVRDPCESLPSWFKLQGLLAQDLTGEDIMDRPHLHHVFKEENVIWFHNEIDFCKSIAPENITVLDSDQFYRDIQGDVRKVRCGRVGVAGRWAPSGSANSAACVHPCVRTHLRARTPGVRAPRAPDRAQL